MFKALYAKNPVHMVCLLLTVVSNGLGGVNMACCCQRSTADVGVPSAARHACCSAKKATPASGSCCDVAKKSSQPRPARGNAGAKRCCGQSEVVSGFKAQLNCCTGCERKSLLTSALILPQARPVQVAATFPGSQVSSCRDSTDFAVQDRAVWITHNRHQAQLGVWLN